MAIIVVRNNIKKLFRTSIKMNSHSVFAGVPQGNAERSDSEVINNATLAYMNDNGSPANNIPARPFMRPGIEAVQPQITEELKRAAKMALDSKELSEIVRVMHRVGLTCQSSIRELVNDGIEPALSPRTIAARIKKGVTTTKPLVVTGSLRNSITYVVKGES